jgi:hypothetical protein
MEFIGVELLQITRKLKLSEKGLDNNLYQRDTISPISEAVSLSRFYCEMCEIIAWYKFIRFWLRDNSS